MTEIKLPPCAAFKAAAELAESRLEALREKHKPADAGFLTPTTKVQNDSTKRDSTRKR